MVRQRADPSSPTVLHSRWLVVSGQTNMTSATAVLCPWFQRTSQVGESWYRGPRCLKSRRTNNVICCRFILCKISLTTLKSSISVLYCFLCSYIWVYAFYMTVIQDTLSHGLPSVYVTTGQIQLSLLLWKQTGDYTLALSSCCPYSVQPS